MRNRQNVTWVNSVNKYHYKISALTKNIHATHSSTQESARVSNFQISDLSSCQLKYLKTGCQNFLGADC